MSVKWVIIKVSGVENLDYNGKIRSFLGIVYTVYGSLKNIIKESNIFLAIIWSTEDPNSSTRTNDRLLIIPK